jgi:hypothetical protein
MRIFSSVCRDAWDSVVELQSQRARQQGQAEFESFISNIENLRMPVDNTELQHICSVAKKNAFSVFDSTCVAPNTRLRNLLKCHIHDRTHALREQNFEVSRSVALRETQIQWRQMKDTCSTSISALDAAASLIVGVGTSSRGPGVWQGVGQCVADTILPDIIALTRVFEFEAHEARAFERDAWLKDVASAQMQLQSANQQVESLCAANDELTRKCERLMNEKRVLEECCSDLKDEVESKSRELQSLKLSSDSAKEALLQQLNITLQENTTYVARVHMLEVDIEAAKQRESELLASMKLLHVDYREKEAQLLDQIQSANTRLTAASDDRQQARLGEENLRIECAVLSQRLQHVSEAAASDSALLQQQLDDAMSKVREAITARDLLETSISRREEEHSCAMRVLTMESHEKESALANRLLEQAQADSSLRQQLQLKSDRCIELEAQLRECKASNEQLVQQGSTLAQVHSRTCAELDNMRRVHEEAASNNNSKMQLLLQESEQNQLRLHELQQSLRRERSAGQDAILAGTEVLDELARLKLQM